MKKTFKVLAMFIALLTCIWSCKKDENRILLEGGTNPQLTVNRISSDVVLKKANKDLEFINLSWTNPDYKFTTGISSQDVTYTLQIDTMGANFTTRNSGKDVTAYTGALGASITVGEFNAFLTKLGYEADMAHDLQIRLAASLNGAAPVYSNVIDISGVVNYEDFAVPPPFTNELWITGDAAPSGWDNPLTGSEASTQKFTRVNKGLYELELAMPGGGNYKLIQENGVWGTQYHMLDGGTWESGEFEMKDSDPGFPGPPSAGNYKITVDFKLGKYSVVRL